MTIGLLLPQTTDGCRSYLAGLDAAGVQAVGLGLGAELPHQRAPARLITAAEEIGMPLLTVPDPVPFIAVTKAVFAYRARAERQELEWALQTQRALTAAAVTPGGLLGILAAHRDATGRTGVVIDLLGRVLAESDPGGEKLVGRMAGLLDSVRDEGLNAAAADISDGRRRELHALGARRLRAWLLIDGPAEQPAAHQVSGDLVSLLSLELERRHGLNTAQRRGRAQVLDRLARATVDDVVAARWLTSVGLPDADLRAAAVAAPDDADDLAADLLITLPDALVRVVGEVVELAVPLDTDLPGVLGTLAGGRAAGIGIAVRPGALVVSLRQARSALPASRVQGKHMHAEEIASSRLLLNTVGAQPLQAYADAVLGPLDATDRAGELMRGLTAFLEHNGHWGSAADRSAGPQAHHAKPHRCGRTTHRAAHGFRAGPPRVVAGTPGPRRRPDVGRLAGLPAAGTSTAGTKPQVGPAAALRFTVVVKVRRVCVPDVALESRVPARTRHDAETVARHLGF